MLQPDDEWFRIWYLAELEKEDRGRANDVRSAVHEVWDKVRAFMQTEQISDEGIGCGEWAGAHESAPHRHGNGGNGKFDIYVGHGLFGTGVSWYHECQAAPTYMEFSLPFPQPYRVVMAHELTHTLQHSYKWPKIGGCAAGDPPGPMTWWAEATAACAESVVYPDSSRNAGAAASYVSDPSRALDDNRHGLNGYQVYQFPLFLYHTISPSVIANIWRDQLPEAASVVEAIDGELQRDGNGGLRKQWPLFSKELTNEGPWQLFCRKNRIWLHPTMKEIDLTLAGAPDQVVDLDPSFGRLSIRYYRVKIGDDVRSVTFMDPFTGQGFENIAVWSLVTIAGQQEEEEWTGKEKITFCRDKRGERVDEIVIVISNSTWTPGAADVVAPRPPRVIATNIGCWQWRGSATWRFEREGVDNGHPFESHMTATSEVTFERTGEALDTPGEVYRPIAGSVSWTCGGNDGRGCGGDLTGAFAPDPTAGLVIFSRTPGEDDYRVYVGGGARKVPASICGQSGECGISWLSTQEVNREDVWRVRANGIMDETLTIDDPLNDETRTTTRTWHFVPLAEPPMIAARPAATAIDASAPPPRRDSAPQEQGGCGSQR